MAPPLTLDDLRARAFVASLTPGAPLGRAIARLGFVQADPIRAPARAQDLILRHRVPDYRAGELERRFARLGIEEDYLYAYGFLPRAVAALLHPRGNPAGLRPKGLAAEVLAFVAERGRTHPAELEPAFGRARTVNGWGQISKATTRVLHLLHHDGHLRVAGRRDGIRLYEAAPPRAAPLAPALRARALVLQVVTLLAPASEVGLGRTFGLLRRGAPGLGPFRPVLQSLLKEGALEAGVVDGERYLWPAAPRRRLREAPCVRFLAPFDPIVWERRRFEHLWGWDYRLEAYTPPARRRFGYYALPLAFGHAVIGWVNLSVREGRLDACAGFIAGRPAGPDFTRSFDAETAAMEAFLGL